MDPAQRASRILSRIQTVKWDDVEKGLPEDKKVKPTFPEDPRKGGPTVSGNQDRAELRHWYSGNWRTSVGKGSGGPV